MNLLIVHGFRVNVPRTPENPRGYLEFMPGMVVTADSIPADQSARDWIDKGLAQPATPAKRDTPSEGGAPASPTP